MKRKAAQQNNEETNFFITEDVNAQDGVDHDPNEVVEKI